MGGRTRCLLVDKNNSNKVYAGSVGGGLYRSVNGGSTWNVVSSIDANNAVVSICQASNGDIYYGTGEVFMGYGGSGHNTTPNFHRWWASTSQPMEVTPSATCRLQLLTVVQAVQTGHLWQTWRHILPMRTPCMPQPTKV